MVGAFDEVAAEAYPLVNVDTIGLQTLKEGFDHAPDHRIPSSGVMIEEDVIPVQPMHFETVHIVLLETGLLPRNLAAGQQTDLQPRPLLSPAQILHSPSQTWLYQPPHSHSQHRKQWNAVCWRPPLPPPSALLTPYKAPQASCRPSRLSRADGVIRCPLLAA